MLVNQTKRKPGRSYLYSTNKWHRDSFFKLINWRIQIQHFDNLRSEMSKAFSILWDTHPVLIIWETKRICVNSFLFYSGLSWDKRGEGDGIKAHLLLLPDFYNKNILIFVHFKKQYKFGKTFKLYKRTQHEKVKSAPTPILPVPQSDNFQ